mgnify:CR=1 FL=1
MESIVPSLFTSPVGNIIDNSNSSNLLFPQSYLYLTFSEAFSIVRILSFTVPFDQSKAFDALKPFGSRDRLKVLFSAVIAYVFSEQSKDDS